MKYELTPSRCAEYLRYAQRAAMRGDLAGLGVCLSRVAMAHTAVTLQWEPPNDFPLIVVTDEARNAARDNTYRLIK